MTLLRSGLHPLALLSLIAGPLAAQEAVVPGASWERIDRRPSALRDAGWRPEVLRQAADALRDDSNATGVVVAHRGRMVLRYGDVEDLSYVASVRKSILAMLYGKYVADGTIDLSLTLEDLGIDDVGGLSEREKQATVEHLITARSGIYHPGSNGGDDLANAPERDSQEPGSYMLYNNWDFNAAGAVFEELTAEDIHDELERQLAIPLQFEDWDRGAQMKSGNPQRSRNLAYHMWISTRDMARIGHLMLNKGRWGRKQVLPAGWSDRITTAVTPLAEMNPAGRRERYFGYGMMWWVWDGPGRAEGPFAGAYTARGAWGQWITVLPALDLVVAVKTNAVYRRTTRWEAWHRLLEQLVRARPDQDAWEGPFPWELAGRGGEGR